MSGQRPWRLDVLAFGWLGAGLLVALSVLSHDPADVYATAVYPRAEVPRNVLVYLAARLWFGLRTLARLAAWLGRARSDPVRRDPMNRVVGEPDPINRVPTNAAVPEGSLETGPEEQEPAPERPLPGGALIPIN